MYQEQETIIKNLHENMDAVIKDSRAKDELIMRLRAGISMPAQVDAGYLNEVLRFYLNTQQAFIAAMERQNDDLKNKLTTAEQKVKQLESKVETLDDELANSKSDLEDEEQKREELEIAISLYHEQFGLPDNIASLNIVQIAEIKKAVEQAVSLSNIFYK